MGELGNSLRAAREGRGLSTQEVEAATRIRHVFIEAMEEERFGDLPGDVYARGFLRTYARFLGLDPDETLAQYRKLRGTKPPVVPIVLDEPLLKRTRPSPWSLIFALLMLALVIGAIGWYLYSRFYLGTDPWPARWTRPTASAEPAATSGAAPTLGATTVAVVGGTAMPTARLVTATSVAVIMPTRTPTLAATSLPSPTPRPLVTRTATPTIAPSPTTGPTPEEIQGIRVQAKVVAPTYVEGRLDQTALTPIILQPGQDQTWEAKETVQLRIGNAAGVELTVNGVAAGSLGASGQVVDLNYTLDTLPGRQTPTPTP